MPWGIKFENCRVCDLGAIQLLTENIVTSDAECLLRIPVEVLIGDTVTVPCMSVASQLPQSVATVS